MEKKFYELTSQERIKQLFDNQKITDEQEQYLLASLKEASDVISLSENTIGTNSLPFSVIYPLKVNGNNYLVPMSIEEPSVVAAAANGAKRATQGLGFNTEISEKLIAGQIVWQTNNTDILVSELQVHTDDLKKKVAEIKPSLVKRGGGLVDFQINTYSGFVELILFIDTVDAMGANIVNTICETVATQLDEELQQQHLFAILSNVAERQLVNCRVEIPFEELKTAALSGEEVAKRINELSQFTQLSDYRAATNNKGILNGIFAVLQATGNDTRAVSVAVAEYLKNQKSLSSWKISDEKLVGKLELPLPIGSIGGAISSLPTAKIAIQLLGIRDVKELMSVVASVGLANNLSAMRAIVTTGIQEGHMSLQAKSLAIAAGAKDDEITAVYKQLNELKQYDLETAKQILKKIRG
ncbi:hydroxymethylglutaryl-CoA reductase, degradative [Lactobacillus sp. YT155]|uniref:hydroxymethylglutaryl-CoA reductase, degradative n=1 Tax=Lactobacillus sp. YT155 TaxID=3060955 RepID=UPI00265FBF2C|nr:hydroxymethylglutaryl-CoA reductase, degradative [Lactobacillus sp. YT155]MDO1605194.1 hydroxymethylglutaryl-CoA reductase, degradative [Lactobacillus sp. YT155]